MGVIRFLGQHKGAVALVMLLLAAKAACDLALPVFTSQIVDVGIAQSGVEDVAELEHLRAAGVDLLPRQMAYLGQLGLLMLGVAAAAMVLDAAVSLVASRTGAAIGRDVRRRLFSQVVAFSEGDINRFSAASLITRGTNDVVLIQNVCTMILRMVLYAPILAIGGVVMVMATNPQMGWIVVVAVAAVFAVIAVLFHFTLPRFKMMQKLIDRVNLVAREMLTGLSVVGAFNRDGYEEERFDEASARLMRTQLFTNRAMAAMMPAMMLVMNLTSLAIVWFGAGAVGAGTLQTGDLIAFITYAMVIIMGCLMMGMISIMLPRADVAAARVREVLETEPSVRDRERARGSADGAPAGTGVGQGGGLAAKGQGLRAVSPVGATAQGADLEGGAATPSSLEAGGARIAFEGVSFRYEDESEAVLEDVSFAAEPGTTLAIVGSTGSGKSTVLKLIERFFDVSAGTVTVDGIDVRLEAPVAQGGANVSGGQRQRLAMARALVRRPRAYLFDDSFSALDYATDARVRSALTAYAAGATKIIVAQRISTVLDADCIVVLEEGRVVGRGTHGELMAACPAYREIALSQLSETELAAVGIAPDIPAATVPPDPSAPSAAVAASQADSPSTAPDASCREGGAR